MANLNLSEQELNDIRRLGSLTFRPLHNRRFRCNQKNVGRLTLSQVDTLRAKVWNDIPVSSLPVQERPKRQVRERPTAEEITEIRKRRKGKRVFNALPQTKLTAHGAFCPNCKTLNHPQGPGTFQCSWCSNQFRAA